MSETNLKLYSVMKNNTKLLQAGSSESSCKSRDLKGIVISSLGPREDVCCGVVCWRTVLLMPPMRQLTQYGRKYHRQQN